MRVLAVLFAGCVLTASAVPAGASQPDISAGYYRKYSCAQLLQEGQQVSARAMAVTHGLADARVSDTASAEDAVIIPGILSSPKPASGELAILKQKLSAIQDATIQSQCQIEFRASGD
jgi:hypothetical protein